MRVKNRYYSRSRIAEAKSRQIIHFFMMDFTSDTTKLTNISVRSITTIYIKLHKKLSLNAKKHLPSAAWSKLCPRYEQLGCARSRSIR